MSVAVPPRITLLTDFGTADGYVGAMKGVIASILPAALIDDISHDIPHGDIAAAAWCLRTHWRFHSAGTVHVCVVDPGVGSARRALAVHCSGQFFIAPDNGLLTPVLETGAASAVQITDPEFLRNEISATFHGRDIFAAAAAHVAGGVSLERLGPSVTDPILLPTAAPEVRGNVITGSVVHVDRFGNMITNIRRDQVPPDAVVTLRHRDAPNIRMVRTYADAPPGDLVALIGSGDVLEIAVRNGSAAAVLDSGRGLRVEVRSG